MFPNLIALAKTEDYFKGELGELEFYFRKITLHQQTFLVVSVLSIRLGCREI